MEKWERGKGVRKESREGECALQNYTKKKQKKYKRKNDLAQENPKQK